MKFCKKTFFKLKLRYISNHIDGRFQLFDCALERSNLYITFIKSSYPVSLQSSDKTFSDLNEITVELGKKEKIES